MCSLEESYKNMQNKTNFENFESAFYSTSGSMPLTTNNPPFSYKFSSGGKSKCYLRKHTALKSKIRKKILQLEGDFCCIPSLLYAVLKNIAFIEIVIFIKLWNNDETLEKRCGKKMTLPTNTI